MANAGKNTNGSQFFVTTGTLHTPLTLYPGEHADLITGGRSQSSPRGSMVPTSSSVSRLWPADVDTVANTNPLPLFVGEVLEGMDIVKIVENRGSASGTPAGKITIANCGTV